MKLSIVIPAKNEEKRLPATLAALCRYITKTEGIDPTSTEIIVVVNNTTDETYEIVRIFQKHFPFIRVFNIPQAIGKGGAIQIGFEKARGEYIAYMDADGASSSYELFKLVNEIIESNADIAIANRYSDQSTILRKLPTNRRVFSKLFRFSNHILFGLKYEDTQCGLKVFKAETGKYLMANNKVMGWTFDMNLLMMANLLGLKVIDIPTIWEYKADSTLNIKKALRTVPNELARSFFQYRIGTSNRSIKKEFTQSK